MPFTGHLLTITPWHHHDKILSREFLEIRRWRIKCPCFSINSAFASGLCDQSSLVQIGIEQKCASHKREQSTRINWDRQVVTCLIRDFISISKQWINWYFLPKWSWLSLIVGLTMRCGGHRWTSVPDYFTPEIYRNCFKNPKWIVIWWQINIDAGTYSFWMFSI